MKAWGKTLVLIDGANISRTVMSLGFRMDWDKFRTCFEEKMAVLRFLYYQPFLQEGQDPYVKFFDWLQYHGYTLRSKPVKTRTDGWWGDMDVNIAVDALNLVNYYDHVILCSGDGDFLCLVEALQFRGIRVTVCSTRASCADELVKQADEFIDLADLKPEIERVSAETPGEPNGGVVTAEPEEPRQ